MNRFVAALAVLVLPVVTHATPRAATPSRPAAPSRVAPAMKPAATLSQAKRISLAVNFASKKPAFSGDPGAIFTGWDAGASSLPVVAKTGSVRVSSGDEQNPQFANYFVTFKKNTPNKLVLINQN